MESGSTATRLQFVNYAVLTDYIGDLLSDIRRPLPVCGHNLNAAEAKNIADAVFSTISSRRFCYLSRKRSAIYRDSLMRAFARDISTGRPIHFYYDIGGGYHAGIDPNRLSLNFQPGLGEILIVRQICLLAQEIFSLYPRGIRFTLVVDNLCALLVNDIPLKQTEAYIDTLRKTIESLDSPVDIDVLVESENFSPTSYVCEFDGRPENALADAKAIANVARFLGRTCSALEASRRIAIYGQLSTQTDRNLNSLVDGIRMTQRATPKTFPFRPFPGSDSRIQAGEIALFVDERGYCRPTLITTENYESWRLFELDLGLEIGDCPAEVLVGVHR